MKTFITILSGSLALVLFVISCNQAEVLAPETVEDPEPAVFTIKAYNASNGNDINTKTTIQAQGKVQWSRHESISFFDASCDLYGDLINYEFTSLNDAPAYKVDFQPGVEVDYPNVSETGEFIGIYPYDEGNSAYLPEWDESVFYVETAVPGDQLAVAGSFADGANVAVGYSTTNTMGFYNLLSGFRFTLENDDIVAVSMTAYRFEDPFIELMSVPSKSDGSGTLSPVSLAGCRVSFEIDKESHSINNYSVFYGGEYTTVYLYQEDEVFDAGTEYYFMILPVSVDALEFEFFKSDETYGKRRVVLENTLSFESSEFQWAEGIDHGVTFVGDPILFADAEMERACLAKFDANEDGILTKDEAAAVTSLGSDFNQYFNNSAVRSFNELEYFTGIQSIPDYTFNHCTNLTSISIPENVKTIGKEAFQDCYNLDDVVLPSGLTTIGPKAFSYCNSLRWIRIPESVTYIGGGAFYNSLSMTSFFLESSTPPELGNNYWFNSNNEIVYSSPFWNASFYSVISGHLVNGLKIFVPEGSLDTYRSNSQWNEYAAIMHTYSY